MEPKQNISYALPARSALRRIIGWVLNQIGTQAIRTAIDEAVSLERTGNINEAEKAFRKAVSVFDSFLLSPVMKRKKSADLTSRLARFYPAAAA